MIDIETDQQHTLNTQFLEPTKINKPKNTVNLRQNKNVDIYLSAQHISGKPSSGMFRGKAS